MNDMNYQVVRKFQGHAIGEVLTGADFVSPHRAAQLISQHYLAPAQSTAVQPTVRALLAASVRKVGELAPQVQDVCVLEAVLQIETREAARKALEKRQGELTNDQSHN